MSSETSIEYWHRRWATGDSPWTLKEVHPKLQTYLHSLTKGGDPKDAGLFMIPLCGKTVDLKFLYQLGFAVLGVDCCEIAIREFFVENGLEFEEKMDQRIGKLLATSDGRLRIFCGDILKMTKDIVGQPVQMVWDRGGLVAVDKEFRKGYAEVLKSLLGPGARYLVSSVVYKDWFFSGPPHNTPPELLKFLFEDQFQNIELLESEDMKDKHLELLQMPVVENTFLMTE